MEIRKTVITDLPRLMEIYGIAREFMAKTGNPDQWGPRKWPPERVIRKDIEAGNSYVCFADDGHICGTFYYEYGRPEPFYDHLSGGEWSKDGDYGVVHRIASDGSQKGIGTFCLSRAFEWCGYLRIDTHPDNKVMRSLLAKLGFTQRGNVHVAEDDAIRYAFDKT